MQLISVNTLLPLDATTTQHGTQNNTILYFRPCPSMDLIAVFRKFTDGGHNSNGYSNDIPGDVDPLEQEAAFVNVYRFNGQKVFVATLEADEGRINVVDAAWRFDGCMLAILGSDNEVRLVDSFSGKVVHKFTCNTSTATTETTSLDLTRSSKLSTEAANGAALLTGCIAYVAHFIDPQTVRARLSNDDTTHGVVLDDLLGLDTDHDSMLKLKADLPGDLANLDVEAYLPRLSTLPAIGFIGNDVFSTRASIDTIFHSPRTYSRGSYIDSLIVAKPDGRIHLRIFDSFQVGEVDLSTAIGFPSKASIGTILQMPSHPFSERVYIIAEGTRAKEYVLHVLSLDMRFIRSTAQTLPSLATKATQLYQLIQYLNHIETVLSRQIKEAFELPARFLRNLNQDLAEQDGEGSTFETTAYHSIVTGEIGGKYREWLSDVLGSRGTERWRKSVHECLELVRNLVQDSWIPALERASLVVSRLAGLAAADSTFGITKKVLNILRDTIDGMSVLSEDVLREVSNEIVEFNAFIRWLRLEVDMASLEDTSEKLEEMRDASDSADVRKVMRYVSNGLTSTVVKKYFGIPGQGGTLQDSTETYEQFKGTRLANGRKSLQYSMKMLVSRLSQTCEHLFDQMASTLRDNILVEYVTEIAGAAELEPSIADSRVIERGSSAEDGNQSTEMRLLLFVREKQRESVMKLFGLELMSGTNAKARVSKLTKQVLDVGEDITDIKFIDDKAVMLLAESAEADKILAVDIEALEFDIIHDTKEMKDGFVQAGLKAKSIEVNGRKNRRTVTLVDQKGLGYAIYDLDSAGGESRDEEMMVD